MIEFDFVFGTQNPFVQHQQKDWIQKRIPRQTPKTYEETIRQEVERLRKNND